MGKFISIVGNSSSGKVSFTLPLASEIQKSSGENVIIIHANRATPLVSYTGMDAGTKSLGKVLEKSNISTADILENMVLLKNNRIAVLSYNTADGNIYPEPAAAQIVKLIEVVRTIIPYVILICDYNWMSALHLRSMAADENVRVIALLTADIKGVIYQQNILKDMEHIPILSQAANDPVIEELKRQTGAGDVIYYSVQFKMDFQADGILPPPPKSCIKVAEKIARGLVGYA